MPAFPLSRCPRDGQRLTASEKLLQGFPERPERAEPGTAVAPLYFSAPRGGIPMRGSRRKVTVPSRMMGAVMSAAVVLTLAAQAWASRGAEDRFRGHRLDADLGGARPHDDRAGAGAVLWRPRPQQERPQPADAEFHHGRAHQRPVGAVGVQPGLRSRSRARGRRTRLDGAPRRRARAERRLCADHPAPGLHDLSVHVRHHHAGAHDRRVRGAHEVQRLPDLLAPVGDPGLRSAGAHGLGHRRPPRQGLGRARLRRRHGGAHQLGRLRAGVRLRRRQTARLRLRAHAATQHALRADRRRAAVVRLVRFQRGQRARRQRARRERLRGYQHRDGSGGAVAGCSRSGWAGEGRPSSARRAARSQDSSPSRPHRDSWRRCRRSPSAPSPGSCATERAT